MTFSLLGTSVSSGIAIGQAVVLASTSYEINHYLIEPEQKEKEFQRILQAKETTLHELKALQKQIHADATAEVSAILEVHIMMLSDATFYNELQHWIYERYYNAEWALDTQFKIFMQRFNEMEDDYLKQRGSDFEQVVNHLQKELANQKNNHKTDISALTYSNSAHPLIIVAYDIAPTDILHFQKQVFTGFITDIGGSTSHSAIIARSMGIPAIVGLRNASQMIEQDDLIIIDSQAGVVMVNPAPVILEEYRLRQRKHIQELAQLQRLKNESAITLDQVEIELLANIEHPSDAEKAKEASAQGIGLYRSEFLFMQHFGNQRKLPTEEEQYIAYKEALEGMSGLPVTIRTIDIGADKPLSHNPIKDTLNPALGLRAIRWSLAEPDIFLTQLRALLRAALHGNLHILIPMLTHEQQIHQTLDFINQAKDSLQQKGIPYGNPSVGAMIEVPAAVLTLPVFVEHFDFLSVGTNDLIQYTLAVDRADESVSNLFDAHHPAVLKLLARTIEHCVLADKKICVCGEMAGDKTMTRLLLGLGLRSFSMHPSQILSVKNELLSCHIKKLEPLAKAVISARNLKAQEEALHALQRA